MICSIIGQWLLDGKSPHTGLPVTETRRLVKKGSSCVYDSAGEIGTVFDQNHRLVYARNKSYAIQLKRGGKAVGRIPPLTSIHQQDVRTMTYEDAIASGFNGVAHYLSDAWLPMHDPLALRQWDQQRKPGLNATIGDFMALLTLRPAERYTAWVLDWKPVDDKA